MYDAWGAPTAKTGTLAATLGTLNPFRYRGYVYDEETGLYYLQSRYYNPVWKRFVNADIELGRVGCLLSTNRFTYCINNPSGHYDDDGQEAKKVNTTAYGYVYTVGTGVYTLSYAKGIAYDTAGNVAEYVTIIGVDANQQDIELPNAMMFPSASCGIVKQAFAGVEVSDLIGKGCYVGSSLDMGLSLAVDMLFLGTYINDLGSDKNKEFDGLQLTIGTGIGIDWVHEGNTYTFLKYTKKNERLFPSANNIGTNKYKTLLVS